MSIVKRRSPCPTPNLSCTSDNDFVVVDMHDDKTSSIEFMTHREFADEYYGNDVEAPCMKNELCLVHVDSTSGMHRDSCGDQNVESSNSVTCCGCW